MNDNIDKNEIRKAIDRIQAEHPCGIAYDPTTFVNMEAVNTIKECVDKIARRMMEDTEINIICEFAKLYLEGVKPTIERPHGEWISKPKRVQVDETDEERIFETKLEWFCSFCDKSFGCRKPEDDFCKYCGSDNRPKEGDPDA